MEAYRIKTPVFEGPMALLMHLIEKNRLDIYDIPIAEVTEQYLAYLRHMEHYDMEIASEFLVMAATLLQIKSRVLLPQAPPPEPEEEDPRRELVERILEYRRFKELSAWLERQAEQRAQFFARPPQLLAKTYAPPAGLALDDLLRAFLALWESAAEEHAVVERENFSVQDKMRDILHLLRRQGGTIAFAALLTRGGTRAEVVAAFLALLELIRLRRVAVAQAGPFGEMDVRLREGESA